MKHAVTVRFTEKEKKEIDVLSQLENLSLSEFIKKRVIEGVNDSATLQVQIQELKTSVLELKESFKENYSSIKNILMEMNPYIIKSSVVTDIQMNYQDDDEMKKKYKAIFVDEINQSKRANLVKESFKV